jgi:PleD family two-component response regulator
VCIAVMKEPDHAPVVFERLRAGIESVELVVDGRHIPIRASIGFTTELCADLAAMINHADTAMYAAKQAGRNRAVRV